MVLGVYWQTLNFEFVRFDDNLYVYDNKHVLNGLTWENMEWAMTAGIGRKVPGMADVVDYWRPLSLMSHMLDVSLFGLQAGAHHLMSAALHALAAAMLFLVMRSLTAAFWRSAFVAALFAVHPLHVESVAWVAERKDVLSGLFFVLSLGAYGRYARHPFRWSHYLLVLACGVMAMISKPMLVTLPFVLFLVDFWPLNRVGVVPWKQLLLEKAPLLAMSALTTILTISGGGATNDVMWAAVPWYYRVGNALLSWGVYLGQTFWPSDLVCFYPFPGIHLAVGKTIVSVIVLVAVTAVVWWKRERRFMVVGWLWYLGMLLPVIGLFRQNGDQAHADRYMYLAMIGLSFMVAWPLAEWAGSQRPRRLVLSVLSAIAILALMTVAHAQVSHWRNTLSLWTHAVQCHPEDGAAHANLGVALSDKGRFEEAITSHRRALALSSAHDQFQARLNLVGALLRTGRVEEAELHLRRAAEGNQPSAEAHSTLAFILLRKGDLQQAIHHLQAAVDIRPDPMTFYNLGNAQAQAGRVSDSIESFLLALEGSPAHTESHFMLGTAYASQGRQKSAAEHYVQALAANPDHLPSLNNLGWILATSRDAALRDGARAVKLIEHALQLPGGIRPHLLHTLAAAYAEANLYPKAVATAQEALQIAKTQALHALEQQLQFELKAYLDNTPWRE